MHTKLEKLIFQHVIYRAHLCEVTVIFSPYFDAEKLSLLLIAKNFISIITIRHILSKNVLHVLSID